MESLGLACGAYLRIIRKFHDFSVVRVPQVKGVSVGIVTFRVTELL